MLATGYLAAAAYGAVAALDVEYDSTEHPISIVVRNDGVTGDDPADRRSRPYILDYAKGIILQREYEYALDELRCGNAPVRILWPVRGVVDYYSARALERDYDVAISRCPRRVEG